MEDLSKIKYVNFNGEIYECKIVKCLIRTDVLYKRFLSNKIYMKKERLRDFDHYYDLSLQLSDGRLLEFTSTRHFSCIAYNIYHNIDDVLKADNKVGNICRFINGLNIKVRDLESMYKGSITTKYTTDEGIVTSAYLWNGAKPVLSSLYHIYVDLVNNRFVDLEGGGFNVYYKTAEDCIKDNVIKINRF